VAVSSNSVFRDSTSFRAMPLVGIKEVAEMIGVSRTRADQLSRRPNFPEPKVRHARVRLWAEADVQAWIAANRPPAD
jgi:prophage regulatory protein